MKFHEFKVQLAEANGARDRALEDVHRCGAALASARAVWQAMATKTQAMCWAAEAMRDAGLELDE